MEAGKSPSNARAPMLYTVLTFVISTGISM
jgi:hypothetical protein